MSLTKTLRIMMHNYGFWTRVDSPLASSLKILLVSLSWASAGRITRAFAFSDFANSATWRVALSTLKCGLNWLLKCFDVKDGGINSVLLFPMKEGGKVPKIRHFRQEPVFVQWTGGPFISNCWLGFIDLCAWCFGGLNSSRNLGWKLLNECSMSNAWSRSFRWAGNNFYWRIFRNKLGCKDANSTEIFPDVEHPVIINMPDHSNPNLGGTMRLGRKATIFMPKGSGAPSRLRM